jgi:ketosteroid isomerase-like protein
MSRSETETVVQRWFDALQAGDVDSAMACLDDDVHWVNSPGAEGAKHGVPGLSAIVPWFGDFRGKAEVTATFGPYGAAQETLHYERLNLMVKDDQAMALVRETARIKATGEVYDIEFVQRYQVADGKIVLLCAYLDTSRMVAAFRGDMDARLIAAARAGDAEAAEALLSFGGCATAVDRESGEAALTVAAAGGRMAVVRALLDHGALPDLVDRTGQGALHAAAAAGATGIVAALLAAGARPDLQRPVDGATALHVAATAGAESCAAVLIDAGARTDLADHAGRRPSDLVLSSTGADLRARLG